ncbi:MAG: hypothetical protein KDK30_10075 [Leptospiraceae bacterium]|nr:hypothetical protein [Leptospiraceae bacterium]
MNIRKQKIGRWSAWLIPLQLAGIAGLASLLAFYLIDRMEDYHLREHMRQQSSFLRQQIHQELSERNRALIGMATRMQLHQGHMSETEWQSNAKAYLQDMRCCLGIEYYNPGLQIHWIRVRESQGIKLQVAASPLLRPENVLPILESAREEEFGYVSPPVVLKDGRNGFLIVHRIKGRQNDRSYLIGIFDFHGFITESLNHLSSREDFQVQVIAGNRMVFRTAHWSENQSYLERETIQFHQQKWDLILVPGPTIESAHRSNTGITVLCMGLVLSILLGAVTYFERKSRLRAREMEELNAKLDRHVQERTRRLTDALQRLQNIREEERRRIARDLHDQLGQELTALKLQLAALIHRGWANSDCNEWQQLLKGFDAIMESVVRIAGDLRPPILEQRSLREAIENMTEEFEQHSGIRVLFEELQSVNLHYSTNIQIYRILQESLTNVARHAQADMVRISLWRDDATVHLSVHDNGRGLPDSPGEARKKRSGLTGMQERARSIQARLSVRTSIEGGTLVELIVPQMHGKRVIPTQTADIN